MAQQIIRIQQSLKVAGEPVDINGLYGSIKEDPHVLDHIDAIPFVDTPLHIAASEGRTDVAIEILRLKPSFGRKLNSDGLSSLHLALINKKFETVKRLVHFDKELIRVKGKEGITPLHFIAKKEQQTEEVPRLKILAEFLFACPDSIEDLTIQNETALHIAVKTKNQGAVEVILGCICRIGRTEVLAYKDVEEQNALDIARSTSQPEIERRLRSAGASEISSPAPDLAKFLTSLERPLEKLYKHIIRVGSMSMEMRSIGQVVAVLIATATFQAVLSPPGGVGGSGSDSLLRNGTSINATNHLFAANTSFINATFFNIPTTDDGDFFPLFYGYNTLAFVLSTLMIMFTLPFQPFFPLHGALFFLMLSYGVSFSIISPSSGSADVFRQVSIGFAFIIYICRFVIDLTFLIGKLTNKRLRMLERFRMLERLLKNN